MAIEAFSLPLETDTTYLQSGRFSYAVFTLWFNQVKKVLGSQANYTQLGSDRMEAVSNLGSYSNLRIVLAEKGFEYNPTPSIRVASFGPQGRTITEYPVPVQNDLETLAEVTARWVNAVHAGIAALIVSESLRVRWFAWPPASASPPVLPPPLFPPYDVIIEVTRTTGDGTDYRVTGDGDDYRVTGD